MSIHQTTLGVAMLCGVLGWPGSVVTAQEPPENAARCANPETEETDNEVVSDEPASSEAPAAEPVDSTLVSEIRLQRPTLTEQQILAQIQAVTGVVGTGQRIGVYRDGGLASVRTADGQPLRGTIVSIYKYRRDLLRSSGQYPSGDYVYDDVYWDTLAALGINAVRLVFFDPWQRSHGDVGSNTPYPHADLWNEFDVRETLNDIDEAVRQAGERNIAVLINYHDTGGYQDPIYTAADDMRHFPYAGTMDYLHRFWELVAPRYSNEAHVFYELTNEPVPWHPNDYTEVNLDDFALVYHQVRSAAPETHIVLLSVATTATWQPERSLLDLAVGMQQRGVDFENASIGFHPYALANIDAEGNLTNETTAELELIDPILELMATGIAVVNTEQNFPAGAIESEDPDSPPLLEGDSTGTQSMERLGISWFQWHTAGWEEIDNLMWLIDDAAANGYS